MNDLSLHGQFSDVKEFQISIARIMEMRNIASRFGRDLYCGRRVPEADVTPQLKFHQAIQHFTRDEQRAIMQWIKVYGPFWEDIRQHSGNDYMEYQNELVTDQALGEAAFCCCKGIPCHLVSLAPSDWMFPDIPVIWKNPPEDDQPVSVPNYWDAQVLETALQTLPAPVRSWEYLEGVVKARCSNLTFARDSFESLRGRPFVDGAAKRILVLLDTLDQFKRCFDAQGQRTPEGHQLYQNHFAGDKASFSDSSDTEKRDFRKELTFPHPAVAGEELFCTWHGKVKTPQYRIHFSWPVRADTPLYVVYIGPKITVR